jgi:general secretion pathway protein C
VETLLRKYLWAVDLAVVVLCASFLGMAASGAVDSKLAALPAPARLAPPKQPKTDTKPTFNKDPTAILRRNIFCSTCPPLIDDLTATAGTGEPPPIEDTKTTLPIALLAIMFAPVEGWHWSVAVMRDNDAKSVGAFATGWKIHGATITKIQETRVYLDNDGKPEYIDLFELPPPPAPPAEAKPTPDKNDPFAAELAAGITKQGENKYELNRKTLESVLGNMGLLSRSARIVPEMKDGKAAGFRFFAVRPDGPFAMIGVQNGDIISSINGLEITSPEKALEVYAKLKSASHLSLGIERNSQKITKEYNIR